MAADLSPLERLKALAERAQQGDFDARVVVDAAIYDVLPEFLAVVEGVRDLNRSLEELGGPTDDDIADAKAVEKQHGNRLAWGYLDVRRKLDALTAALTRELP